MTFRSTAVRGAGSDWVLEGDLTIGDVTRPITLDVELGGVETFGADGTRHAGFEATGELRRKDFGIDFGPMFERRPRRRGQDRARPPVRRTVLSGARTPSTARH